MHGINQNPHRSTNFDRKMSSSDELMGWKALVAIREARILELEEKCAFLESREVCAAAHENVETCGYCQRDKLIADIKGVLDGH
jgi:hypothetical protein